MVFAVYWIISPQSLPGEMRGESLALTAVIWGICWLLFGVGLPLFIYLLKMIIEVQDNGIFIRFVPLLSRFIPFEDVKQGKVHQFKPFQEYGGMGARFVPGKGWAYFLEGTQGVLLELMSGGQVLLGSRQPEELLSAIMRRKLTGSQQY
jgi:hypothetical protein